MTMKLFHYDGPLGQFMLRLWELLLLNIICILFCIPVITSGASLTAVSYVTLRMAEGREDSVSCSFLRSFKENLVQSTVLAAILTFTGLLLYLDARYIFVRRLMTGTPENTADTLITAVLAVILVMALLFYLMTLLYVFAVQARFRGTVYSALRNASLMSVRHLPVTLLLILMDALFYLIAVRYLPWLLLWCCSGPAALNAIWISRCLRNYQSDNE